MSEVRHFEAEAEAIRTRIVDSIEELADRLSPQTIIREAKAEGRKAFEDAKNDGMRALLGVRDQAADVVDQTEQFILDNPWAVGLAAVAVGMAVTVGPRAVWGRDQRGIRSGGDEYADYEQGDGYAVDAMRSSPAHTGLFARARNRVGDARAALADAAEGARSSLKVRYQRVADRAGRQVDSTSARLTDNLDRARDAAADAATSISDVARTGVRRTGAAIADNPEATVLVSFAAGALLGLASDGRELSHVEDWS